VRSIFLSETNSLSDGSHVEPVFKKSGAVHQMFLRTFLKQSSEELQNHYGALVFTGKSSMPRAFNTDEEVVSYVAKTRGAIGYVSASAATEGVKVLEVTDEPGRSDRRLLTRVEPEYPEVLRSLKITGTVRLAVTILPTGSVESVQLLGGNPILGEAATKAVRQWIYAPGPSRTRIQVTVQFENIH
jgi:TonB family protein